MCFGDELWFLRLSGQCYCYWVLGLCGVVFGVLFFRLWDVYFPFVGFAQLSGDVAFSFLVIEGWLYGCKSCYFSFEFLFFRDLGFCLNWFIVMFFRPVFVVWFGLVWECNWVAVFWSPICWREFVALCGCFLFPFFLFSCFVVFSSVFVLFYFGSYLFLLRCSFFMAGNWSFCCGKACLCFA